jgi:hypothetical protein
MTGRREGGRAALALLPALALLLVGCAGSASVTIGPEVSAAGPTGAGTGATPSGTGSPSGAGRTASSPARTSSSSAWGGGTRVGSYRTTGTVHGVQGGASDSIRVAGTCDLARDVRTVTAKLDPTTTLVIDVTGRNVASVAVTVRGGTTWLAEYVGSGADDVVTLTRSRTVVEGARLVRTTGPAAAPVTVDADFDC